MIAERSSSAAMWKNWHLLNSLNPSKLMKFINLSHHLIYWNYIINTTLCFKDRLNPQSSGLFLQHAVAAELLTLFTDL
jgi:hypothetical protein